MNNYGAAAGRRWSRGEGAVVVDDDGQEYLDLLGGIAVNALGHAHPAVVAAVTEQIATLGHVSNLFTPSRRCALAERLLALAGRPGPGVLLQLRRRGQRGRVQAGPAAPAGPTSSPPPAASTAAPWARSR